jgi:hypothetical protein
VNLLAQVGYLLRNAGFRGNGKHGSMAFAGLPPAHPLSHPYHAEMLALILWREYGCDLAEHIAQARTTRAVRLDPAVRRYIGLGNGSGLGLAMFVVKRAQWFHRWCLLRETALAHASAQDAAPTSPETRRLRQLLDRCVTHFNETAEALSSEVDTRANVFTPPATIAADLSRLRGLVAEFAAHGTIGGLGPTRPWLALRAWASEELDVESQEVLNSLLIELYPAVVDELDRHMVVEEEFDVAPGMTVGELRELLRRRYAWALSVDRTAPGARHYFYYWSIEGREPRLGVRGEDFGQDFEFFADVPGGVQQLEVDLVQRPAGELVARFLLSHPQHQLIVQRVQSLGGLDYAEVIANLIAGDFVPLHLIRFVMSIFGFIRFDPKSDRWVQATILQGAPSVHDLAAGREDDWIFPLKPSVAWG